MNTNLAREEVVDNVVANIYALPTVTNDPRTTKIGKFIRKTSIDEFPQFINVIKGDMSLVEPRPYLPRECEDMENAYPYITAVKSGDTGLRQVLLFSDKGILQSAKGVA